MNVSENSTLSLEINWYPNALGTCWILQIFGTWMFVCMLMGSILNGLVVHLFATHKDLRSPTNTFLISISIADFLACVFEIPMPMVSNFVCRWPFGKFGCYTEGFIAYLVGNASMYLLCFVSVDRYIAIARPLEHQKVTHKVVLMCTAFSWLQSFFWAGAPLLGWSGYALEGALTSCSVQWQDKSLSVQTYNMLMFVFVFFVPVSLMLFCNMKLYMTIRHMNRHGVWNLDDPKAKKKLEVEKRIAKTAALMVAGFLLAWSPYAAVAAISAFGDPNSISPIMATVPALFAKTQVIWNPLIYVATNKNFRAKLPFLNNKTVPEKVQENDASVNQIVNKTQPAAQQKPQLTVDQNDEISAACQTEMVNLN